MTDSTDTTLARRRLLRAGLGAVALVAAPRLASAADLPKLSLDDTAAKALAYVHDASSLSAADRGGADRNCANCRFYTVPEGDWGPCTLFPGKSVAAAGWCKGWVARA